MATYSNITFAVLNLTKSIFKLGTFVGVLFVLSTCFVLVLTVSDMTLYSGFPNWRLTESYREIKDDSVIKCVAFCSNDEKCIAFNYQKSTRTCELVTQENIYPRISDSSGWTAFFIKTELPKDCHAVLHMPGVTTPPSGVYPVLVENTIINVMCDMEKVFPNPDYGSEDGNEGFLFDKGFDKNNHQKFSTYDVDQDNNPRSNFATDMLNGWWNNACSTINPYENYLDPGTLSPYADGKGGIVSKRWRVRASLKSTQIMFRGQHNGTIRCIFPRMKATYKYLDKILLCYDCPLVIS